MAFKRLPVLLVVMVIIAAGVWAFFFYTQETQEFRLIPKEVAVQEYSGAGPTEVGTGWSVKGNPEEAVAEAVAMALAGKKQAAPHFAVLFANSGSDLPAVLSAARKRLEGKTKIYGGTSDSRALMINKKFVRMGSPPHAVETRVQGVAIMTVTSEEITFGVGSADFAKYPSVQQAAREATRQAMANAGKSPAEIPQAVLITPTFGPEDQVLEGIAAVVGTDALILGGTAGGPKFGVFGEHGVYETGLSLAVLYTHLPLAWIFEGGFDTVDTPSGIVTKMAGRDILEIDHRPALEVYDQWLGGQVSTLIREGADLRKIRDVLTLHPLVRRYAAPGGQDFLLFSHPYPTKKALSDKSISTSTNIQPGDRVYLSHGTWETLLNRIGNLPLNAKVRSLYRIRFSGHKFFLSRQGRVLS